MKNYINKLPFFILASAIFLLASCAGSKSRLKVGQTDEGEVVEAVGYAPNDQSDILKTQRASLVDAQRNAVEKAVGVIISGKTMVEKAVAIENNILAKTEGYVKKFDILHQKPKDDLYETKIRALVAIKDLEADLKSMSLLDTPELQRPRVSITLEEKIDELPSEDSAAKNTLEQVLKDNGYTVMGSTDAKKSDLVMSGKASSYPFESEKLGGFVSFRARISLQVKKPGSDEVVYSYSNEASGLGGNETLAGLKSLENVGRLAGEELSNALLKWSKKPDIITLVIDGVATFDDVDRIKKHISAQPEVVDLILRMYEEQRAEFEVQVNDVSAADVGTRLQKSKSYPLTVVETSTDRIRLKVEKGFVTE